MTEFDDRTPSYDDSSGEKTSPGQVEEAWASPPDAAAMPAPAEEEVSLGRWIIETVLLVAAAFALAMLIKFLLVQPYIIPTGSMIPTIQINDRVLAEKVSYRFREPEYGEIVVFDDPTGQHPQLIKRVIATEGQTIDIRDQRVLVDGKPLDEQYTYGLPTDRGTVEMPMQVPPGYVFLMGDNRPNSGDSRFIGPQPNTAIRGRAVWTYWPLSRFGKLQ